MRINQYLASCGLTSRRKAEELVLQGRVKVNNQIVTNLSTVVSEKDIVECDGKRVALSEEKIYLMINKPKGYLTSVSDDRGRPTIMKLVEGIKERVYPVGRLDFNTEGLLLLTNDGEFANSVMHPSKHIAKTYKVTLKSKPKPAELELLRKGILLDDVKTLPAIIGRPKNEDGLYTLDVTIFEGKNREVRRMFEHIGYKIYALKRTKIGQLELGDLPLKSVKKLNKSDLKLIYK